MSAPNADLAGADLATARRADAAPPGAWPELLTRPWDYLGISRSCFFRLRAADRLPRPVALPGHKRPLYRRSDLAAWVARLPGMRRQAARRIDADGGCS